MPDTMNLPGLGNVDKKYVLIGGGVVVIGAAVYYRKHQQQQAVAAAGSSEIDPATGYAYGSAEDAAALAAQANYISSVGGAGSGVGGGSATSNTPGSFTNNSQWTQYVINYFINNNLVSDGGATLSNALGKYINGLGVTSDEHSLINQAVAIAGQPPASGADGYPPHVRTDNSGANIPAVPNNAHAINVLPTRAEIVWEPVTGATGYRVREAGGYDVFTADTYEVVDNLAPSHPYSITVRAVNGDVQGADATVSFTTPGSVSGYVPSPGSPNGGPTGVNSGGTNAPGIPTGLRVASSTPYQVALVWDSVPGATGYRVRHTGGYDAYTGYGYESIGNLSPGQTYTMTVQAVNATGQGQPASITFTTPLH